MLIDASFSPLPAGSAPQSLVLGAGIGAQIGMVLDLLGVGAGVAPPNIIGSASLFGASPGSGVIKPVLLCITGTAFATSNSATLNVQLQYAADTGSSGAYQPGTWYTQEETGTIAAANLTANTQFAQLEFSPAFPFTVRPRFIRLYASIASGTNFTAGTISFAGVLLGRDELGQKQASRNYTVA